MFIDCDTHYMAPNAFDYMDAAFAAMKPVPKMENGLYTGLAFPGRPAAVPGTTPLEAPPTGSRFLGNADIESRMVDYEKLCIERQLLLPQMTGWWSYLIEPKLASAMAHSWNLSILRHMQDYPRRIEGVALVALQDVSGAIAELDWAVENGFKAAVLDFVYPVKDHPYGTMLASHRELWPFFKRAEELAVPLILHPVQHGHRIVNLMSFQTDGIDFFAPVDQEMSLVALITSGLLDEYPGLRFVIAETGTGYIKDLAKRLDAWSEHKTPRYHEDEGASALSRRKSFNKVPHLVPPEVAKEKNKRQPSDYFRTNLYWTIETEEPELVEAIEFIGPTQFLFATDYPHDDPGGRMKFHDTKVLMENKKLSADVKDRIAHRNAIELFRLET